MWNLLTQKIGCNIQHNSQEVLEEKTTTTFTYGAEDPTTRSEGTEGAGGTGSMYRGKQKTSPAPKLKKTTTISKKGAKRPQCPNYITQDEDNT